MARGFTIIEITIAIGFILLVATLGLATDFDSYRRYAFYTNRTILVTALRSARSLALGNVDQEVHGVHVDVLGTTLFHGTLYASSSPKNEFFPFTIPVTQALGADVVFSQLVGTTTGVVLVITDGVRRATTTITYEGAILW